MHGGRAMGRSPGGTDYARGQSTESVGVIESGNEIADDDGIWEQCNAMVKRRGHWILGRVNESKGLVWWGGDVAYI